MGIEQSQRRCSRPSAPPVPGNAHSSPPRLCNLRSYSRPVLHRYVTYCVDLACSESSAEPCTQSGEKTRRTWTSRELLSHKPEEQELSFGRKTSHQDMLLNYPENCRNATRLPQLATTQSSVSSAVKLSKRSPPGTPILVHGLSFLRRAGSAFQLFQAAHNNAASNGGCFGDGNCAVRGNGVFQEKVLSPHMDWRWCQIVVSAMENIYQRRTLT